MFPANRISDLASRASFSIPLHWNRGVEWVAVFVAASLIGLYAYLYGGQLGGSDMLLYLDAGLRGYGELAILNRYTHVFLLALIDGFSPNPLEGLRLFSLFSSALTVILVYYIGRRVTPKSSPVNGVVAVLLILSLQLPLALLLQPGVDTTAMLIVLLFSATYVRWDSSQSNPRWLVLLLGFLFFLALKTKETTIVLAITLPGLIFLRGRSSSEPPRILNIWYFAIGIVAALILLIVGNTIVLNAPLFGLRPSEFLEFAQAYSSGTSLRPAPGDIFRSFILTDLALPFLLFVASGLMRRSELSSALRILWLVPLALSMFLTLSMVQSTWGVVPRFFLPGIALMCALAGQVVSIRWPEGKERKLAIGYLLSTGIVLLSVGLLGLSLRSQWPFPDYFFNIFAPIVLAVLIGLLILNPGDSVVGYPVLLCILALTVYPIRLQLPEIARTPSLELPNARFDSFAAFDSQITPTQDMTLLVSASMLRALSISNNREELSALFNVYFDATTDRDNFKILDRGVEFVQLLVHDEFGLVLISSHDWDWLRESPNDRPEWRDRYQPIEEDSGRFILLKLE